MDDLRIEFGNVMAEVIGPEDGVTEVELEEWREPLAEIVERVEIRRKAGEMEFLDLPDEEESLIPPLEELAAEARQKFDNFVVVGIGGSALGPRALLAALAHPFYHLLNKEERGGNPRIFFSDNVDPDLLRGLLDVIEPERTLFNIISKSGSTVETMANFMVFYQALSERIAPEKIREHLVLTTDPLKGPLRRLAVEHEIAALNIPPGVGGRFSVLTPVGLFPAAMAGIDIRRLLAGARRMAELCRSKSVRENPALLSAFLNYRFDVEKGKNILVMMPYSHRLREIADWFRQLWAESLGKEERRSGEPGAVGSTPVKALGAAAQHSQIQLYMEGPPDKLFIFLRPEEFSSSVELTRGSLPMEEVEYLEGKGLGELLLAEQLATQSALARKSRPNYTVHLPRVNAFYLGQLIFLLEAGTAYAGELYNVNAFDQPGVETGKILAKGLMGKAGFEEERDSVDKLSKQGHGFVCPSGSGE